MLPCRCRAAEGAVSTGFRYRAAAPDTLSTHRFDAFLIVYHRPSGQTHLLSEPAPEMLAAIGADEPTADELTRRLGDSYDLTEFSPAALAARLDELVAAGLVERL